MIVRGLEGPITQGDASTSKALVEKDPKGEHASGSVGEVPQGAVRGMVVRLTKAEHLGARLVWMIH